MTDKDRKIKRTGPIKNEENELVYEDKKKAEPMNKYFSNIGSKLAKEFITKEDSMQTFIHQVTPAIENTTPPLLMNNSKISLKRSTYTKHMDMTTKHQKK